MLSLSSAPCLLTAIAVVTLFTAAIASAQPPASHPIVYRTAEDVARARDNIKRYDWARSIAAETITQADEWLARSDEWLADNTPGKGACFAYGFTGCPICGGSWGWWEKADCSFDSPGHVKCSGGHSLPDADHPDPGTGYVAPDGRIHYFVGSYNSWAIEQLTLRGAESLAFAYSLTGDERYAAKAALILDLVANIYPSCDKGSWDYPSDPPSGRLNRPWYQVARVLVRLVDAYDQIYHSKSLDQPSVTSGLSRRANIEENILKNGAKYCYEQSLKGGLHNGEADYIRGSLAVGVCLGIPAYVTWAVDGPYGILTMLDNNLDRDGLYYETSSLYSSHARALYLTFANPLRNYRGDAYPNGVDLYSNPKFAANLFLSDLATNLAGHTSTYGDSAPDTTTKIVGDNIFYSADYLALQRLYVRTAASSGKATLGETLAWLARNSGKDEFEAGDKRFMLFSFEGDLPKRAKPSAQAKDRVLNSVLFGQKGIAVLRSGSGKSAQGLMLRYGPALTHSHRDDLNINYVALGADVSYDIGYSLGSTHTQVGWAAQTASHNLVVVDETSQLQGGKSGGSLHLFASEPGMSMVEASSEASYSSQKVKLYRRTTALIGGDGSGPDSQAYCVDIFRVKGGSTHDYIYHSRSETVDIKGAQLGQPRKGSLAGQDIDWMSAQLNDGDMKGHPNRPYWNPPPGSGYGFLSSPAFGTASGSFSADWRIDDSVAVRLLADAGEQDQIIVANAPGLYPKYPRSKYLIWRRTGENLSSTFAAAIEPYSKTPKIESVRRLLVNGPEGEFEPVCLEIKHSRGIDYVYSSPDTKERSAGGMTFAARFAVVRAEGAEVASAYMVEGRLVKAAGCTVSSQEPAWRGRIADITLGADTFRASSAPASGQFAGRPIIFSASGYSRTTAYTILGINPTPEGTVVKLHSQTVLGRGVADSIRTDGIVQSKVPHEYARSKAKGGDTGFFTGKTIVGRSGNTSIAKKVWLDTDLFIRLSNAGALAAGEPFQIADIKQSDSFAVPGSVALVRTHGGYKLSGTPAEASLADGSRL